MKAIKLLSSGKAPGLDAIPAETYKAGGPPVLEKLAELFHIMWRNDSIIQGCNNYPTIQKEREFLSLRKSSRHPFIVNCLEDSCKSPTKPMNEHLEQSGLLPDSQCGFRKDIGTIDMIFTAKQLQEKCQEQNVDLYMTFVDLTKAFDRVSCGGVLKSLAKFGCPAKFIAMVRQFHDGRLAGV